MKAVLALAFLALAKAAIIEIPRELAEDAFFDDSEIAVHPNLVRSMIYKYGFVKPVIDDEFISFARSMGVHDDRMLSRLHHVYDEPALVLFKDPVDSVVSFYADEGIHKAHIVPELKAIFADLLGASDSFGLVFEPEHMLGEYKSILPGHFFHPVQDVALSRVLLEDDDDMSSHMHAIVFKKPEIFKMFPGVKHFYGRFDIDEMPFAYRYPVALKFDFVPSGHDIRSYVAPSHITKSASTVVRTPSSFVKSALPYLTSAPAYYPRSAYPVADLSSAPAYYPRSAFPVADLSSAPAYYPRSAFPVADLTSAPAYYPRSAALHQYIAPHLRSLYSSPDALFKPSHFSTRSALYPSHGPYIKSLFPVSDDSFLTSPYARSALPASHVLAPPHVHYVKSLNPYYDAPLNSFARLAQPLAKSVFAPSPALFGSPSLFPSPHARSMVPETIPAIVPEVHPIPRFPADLIASDPSPSVRSDFIGDAALASILG